MKLKRTSMFGRRRGERPSESDRPLQPRSRREQKAEEDGRGRRLDSIEIWVMIAILLITVGSLGRCMARI
jgi:hypothetical protein